MSQEQETDLTFESAESPSAVDFFSEPEQEQEVQPVVEASAPAMESPVQEAVQQPESSVAQAPVSAQTDVQPAAAPIQETEEDDVAVLRRQLNEVLSQTGQLAMQMAQAQQQAAGPTMTLPEDPREASQLDFLQGREVADVLGDPAAFNGLLNTVATVAARAGQQAGYEQALRSIPSVVQSTAQQHMTIRTTSERFFQMNPDLEPFRSAVSVAAVDFASKNPNAGIDDVLKAAGEKTRAVLRLRGTTVARVPAQPATAINGMQRTAPAPTLNPVEQQILELVDLA